MKAILKCAACLSIVLSFSFPSLLTAEEKKHANEKDAEAIRLSPQTQACIGCHSMIRPGIVEERLYSRHSKTVPSEAMSKPQLQRRIAADSLPPEVSGYVVGCFECHGRNPQMRKDKPSILSSR